MPDSDWKDQRPIASDDVEAIHRRHPARPVRQPTHAFAEADATWLEQRWIHRNLPVLQAFRDPERGLVFSLGPLKDAQRFTLSELRLLVETAEYITLERGC